MLPMDLIGLFYKCPIFNFANGWCYPLDKNKGSKQKTAKKGKNNGKNVVIEIKIDTFLYLILTK